jgi:hypothetical protein
MNRSELSCIQSDPEPVIAQTRSDFWISPSSIPVSHRCTSVADCLVMLFNTTLVLAPMELITSTYKTTALRTSRPLSAQTWREVTFSCRHNDEPARQSFQTVNQIDSVTCHANVKLACAPFLAYSFKNSTLNDTFCKDICIMRVMAA